MKVLSPEVNGAAREWLDELATDARKRGGDVGRQALEVARPKLKGTAVEAELEASIRDVR